MTDKDIRLDLSDDRFTTWSRRHYRAGHITREQHIANLEARCRWLAAQTPMGDTLFVAALAAALHTDTPPFDNIDGRLVRVLTVEQQNDAGVLCAYPARHRPTYYHDHDGRRVCGTCHPNVKGTT